MNKAISKTIFFLAMLILVVATAKQAFSTSHPSSYLNHSNYDYYSVVGKFILKPLSNSTDCSKINSTLYFKMQAYPAIRIAQTQNSSDLIAYETYWISVQGDNCSYWDKRQLDYYADCVTYEGIVPELGVTIKDDCGAMSVPVKLK